MHLLELRVGCLVAMLDGICAGIDRGLYAGLVDGMDGDLEVLNVVTSRDELASRSQDPWANDAASVDCITQFSITINARVTKISNGRNATLQILPSRLRAHQHSFAGRFDNRQQ